MQALIESKELLQRILILGVAIFLLLLMIERAWISDDAFITLRTVDNFVAGNGLVYNVAERVQTYTHPLWMLFLSVGYLLWRDAFYMPILLSIVVTTLAVLVIVRRIKVSWSALLVALILLSLSNAFLDYSSSGLENPLSYLLLALFLALAFTRPPSPRKLLLLSFLSSLAAVNRLDSLLLYLPLLFYEFYRLGNPRKFYILLVGQLPLLIWLAFSTIYYGYPFPNTMYAKLNTGIPQNELWMQGGRYFLESIVGDPITLLTIVIAWAAAIWTRSGQKMAVAMGILLYLVYVLMIGGDFMSGRFFAVPFFAAVILLARQNWDESRLALRIMSLGFLLVIGVLLARRPTWIPASVRGEILVRTSAGIADERRYYEGNSLVNAIGVNNPPNHKWAREGLQAKADRVLVYLVDAAGMRGFFAGPSVHVVDENALVDPLLSRLPAIRNESWRIGHFERVIPDGYLETLEAGDNLIADKALAEYYEHVQVVTRGRIWDSERLRTMWWMNLGQYDHLIDRDEYRNPGAKGNPELGTSQS